MKFKSGKNERRREKRDLKRNPESYSTEPLPMIATCKPVKPLHAMTEAQHTYLQSFDKNIITFGIGSAGTGKTYCAGAYAADLIKNGEVETIIITRPAVEAGESFGFLPGELEDKYAPYLEPFKFVLNERLGKSYVDYLIKTGRIIASPLSFMRGRTFTNAVVILDEAQNTTPSQMMLFLTRIGQNCKVIIDGDLGQKDISGISGLQDAISKLRHVNSINVVEFGIDDVVRSGIVKDILIAYQK